MLCGRATRPGQKNVEIAVPMRNQVMAVRHQPWTVSVSEITELEREEG